MSDAQPVDGAESLPWTTDMMQHETSDTSDVRQAPRVSTDPTSEPARTLLSQSSSAAPHYRRSLFRR